MIVASILNTKGRDVFSVAADTPVRDAARYLQEKHVGAALVLNEDGGPAGLVQYAYDDHGNVVAVTNGLFKVELGSVIAFPDGLFDGSTVHLGPPASRPAVPARRTWSVRAGSPPSRPVSKLRPPTPT